MFFSRKNRSLTLNSSALALLALTLSLSAFGQEQVQSAKQKAAAAASTGPLGADKPWVLLQNQMLILRTKRIQLMQKIASLKAESKQQSSTKETPAQAKRQMDDLSKTYAEYKQVTEEYNKLVVALKYRYPERLSREDTSKLKAETVESLENLEAQIDIDARLTKAYKKARTQYVPQERAPAAAAQEAQQKKTGDTIRDQEPILYSR